MTVSQTDEGVSLEVLGTCKTNPVPNSTHDARVEYRHLWSYAQQAALIAVSEKNPQTQCYHLITDPERRAKRIAAYYADLYFKSAEKSNRKVQFYWVALAAFVVKDIVEAYRFAREEVLHREWKDAASVARNSVLADLGSLALTNDSPYQHALRTYAALAKGNLWLFMDIYPWLWFFLEYGINADGSLNRQRLDACLPERSWSTFQEASKAAVEELPFGPNWTQRLNKWLKSDPIYQKASGFFQSTPTWDSSEGYGAHTASAYSAHAYCRSHVRSYDSGYRTPGSEYWGKFKEAFYIMESEHQEMSRVATDSVSLSAIIQARNFTVTPAVTLAFSTLIKEYTSLGRDKVLHQKAELVTIANQEQINVLQPLIYNDPKLKETMDTNHKFSRMTGGWISPKFKVIYSASPTNVDPELETVFDPSIGMRDQFFGNRKSLPNQGDRMEFVSRIARDFNRLMDEKRSYMEGELRKIHKWVNI